MNADIIYVFAVLIVTVVLFASDRVRLDIVAILAVLALALGGIVTAKEAVAGFGDSVVILIAGLFVVGEGLFQTGVAYALGNWLTRVAGQGEVRLIGLMMLVVAVLSAFMSSTGAVAIFIPVALSLAARAGSSPSRLMMPLSIAALIGGMLTLIGTPPNLVVSEALRREGLEAFSFFAFTPIGLIILALSVGYVIFVGRALLPDRAAVASAAGERSMADLAAEYGVSDRLHRLRIPPGSALAGTTVGQATLRKRYGITVLAIEREGRFRKGVVPALVDTALIAGDVLYVSGDDDQVEAFVVAERLEPRTLHEKAEKALIGELGVGEVMLTPSSPLVGRTLRAARFRERYSLSVIALRRKGEPFGTVRPDLKLEFGDSLLVGGSWKHLGMLQSQRKDFLVLELPVEMREVAPARARAPLALAVMLGMLVLMTFGIVPSVIAVLIAALAMVVAGCVSMDGAYKCINWQSLVLIAGMLPMATALEKTGGIELLVNTLVEGLGQYGALPLMAGLFVITSVFSQFISNTATTVLIAPVAIGAAMQLQVSPYPLLMTVAIAASTAFSTPVASPVNTLVLGPGHYAFNDFVKVGVPLQLLCLIVTLIAVPLVFPL